VEVNLCLAAADYDSAGINSGRNIQKHLRRCELIPI
jgi:hypothetical protein